VNKKPSLEKIFSVVLALLLVLTGSARPQDGRTEEQEARKAYRANDFPTFLAKMKAADELRPNHPRIVYNLASAFSLNAKPAEAFQMLRRLVVMKLVHSPEKDKDFDTLKGRGEFSEILSGFEKNRLQVGTPRRQFSLDEKGLIAEGLAFDPITGSTFLSSVHKRKIVRIDKQGGVTDFSNAADGLWCAMGMQADTLRRKLWLASSALPQMERFDSTDEGKAGVFEFDIDSRKLLHRYTLSNEREKHVLGDLTVRSDGAVFATDSRSPNIYCLLPGRDSLEVFLSGKQFWSLQGLAFSADERFLLVADYARGLFVVDVVTKQSRLLPPPSNATTLGIDGIYRDKSRLIGVQNGINPRRIVQIELPETFDRISSFNVLVANDPTFEEPSLGTLMNGKFCFIANSQWNRIDDQGRLAPESELTGPVILSLDLR
jgi:hypothetical protein